MTSPSKEVKVPSDHSSTVHSDNLLIISDDLIIAKELRNVFSRNSEIFMKKENYLIFLFCQNLIFPYTATARYFPTLIFNSSPNE